MSDHNEREREERAFEALIASQLRRDRDIDKPDDLPELTEADQAAMDALDPNLIESLWKGEEPARKLSTFSGRITGDYHNKWPPGDP